MLLRCAYLAALLICGAPTLLVAADMPPDSRGCKTIEELFSAYKKATEGCDWQALFLLGTPERQDSDLLALTVSAATSNDQTLRSLVEAHGANWKQFSHAWSDADNQRFMREYSTIAASLGKQVKGKVAMFAAAQSHIAKMSEPSSIEVRELRDLIRHGTTASGDSIERRTCTERHMDAQGNQTGQVSRTFSVTSRLWFRQIDGCWYLATENEITPVK